MKKLLLLLLFVTVSATAALLYEKIVVDQSFGPTAGLATSIGIVTSVFLITSLLLYESSHRESIIRVWMIGVSVVVTFVVFDLVIGYFFIQPLSPPLVPDAYRHHKLVPNSSARLEQQDFSYIQNANSFGLRGKDFDIIKDSGTFRILMLGDSFTMGKGVEEDETFSVLLEKSLNEKTLACSGKNIEVLNGGVDGYAPVLSYLFLKRELSELEPDLIVLNLDQNDLIGEDIYRGQAVYGEAGQVIAVPAKDDATPMERFRSWSERNLYFTRLILLYVNQFFGYKDVRSIVTRANYEVLAHTLEDDKIDRKQQWENLFESIINIKIFSDQRGIDFLLTTYPHAHQVNETEGIPGRYGFVPKGASTSDRSLGRLHQFAADNGVWFSSMFSLFRNYNGPGKLYFNYDTHWTSRGHRLMARGIEEQITMKYLDQLCH